MLSNNLIPNKFYMLEMDFMRDIVYGFGYEMEIITNTMKKNWHKKGNHYGLYGGYKESIHKFEDNDGKIYTFKVGVGDDASPDGNRIKIIVLSETEQDCVTVFIDESVGDAILHNVSYYRDCAKEGLRRPGVKQNRILRANFICLRGGTILLRFIHKYLLAIKNKYKIKRIVLRDNSQIYCEKCSHNIKLARLKMLTHGRTWYSKYGFMPYDPESHKPDKIMLKKYELNKKIILTLKTSNLDIIKIANEVKKKEKLDYKIDEIKRLTLKYPLMCLFVRRLVDEYPKYCCLIHYILEKIYKPMPPNQALMYDMFGQVFYLDI